VRASHETPYGTVSSAWTLRDERFELTVDVPPNAKATVRLPRARVSSVSGKPLVTGDGITGIHQDEAAAVVEIGSGRYDFAYSFARAY
jgi:alpha-L-rhamnosidase